MSKPNTSFEVWVGRDMKGGPVCVFANRPWYEDGCFNGRLDQLEIELNGIGLDFDVPAGHCQKFTFQLTPAGRAEKGDSASEEKL